jgi:hypothetical protein
VKYNDVGAYLTPEIETLEKSIELSCEAALRDSGVN